MGDNWRGSNARSLREAFEEQPELHVRRVDTDTRTPIPRGVAARVAARFSTPLKRSHLEQRVKSAIEEFRPDAVVFYKGTYFSANFLRKVSADATLVNCFPDYSPHAYGKQMKEAMGVYDLVISTKSYHPVNWRNIYGYENRCVFVAHGYDPGLHLRSTLPSEPTYDVVLVAAGRPEYYELVRGLARELEGASLHVGIGGNGWRPLASSLPRGWELLGPKFGDQYVDLLRKGSIVVAPVQRYVSIGGIVQPGDEDTARTYEIAAAHCFFIHQRTAFVSKLYDEATEVALYDTAEDLAKKIRYYLGQEALRGRMATAAHSRAVPAYSTTERAKEIVSHIQSYLTRGEDTL